MPGKRRASQRIADAKMTTTKKKKKKNDSTTPDPAKSSQPSGRDEGLPYPDSAPSSEAALEGDKGSELFRVKLPDLPTSLASVQSEGYSLAIEKGDLIAQHRNRPTVQECLFVTTELAKLHPEVIDQNNQRRKQLLSPSPSPSSSSSSSSCGDRETIADGVVNTILSQNTTSANSTRAFANLKKAFPTWNDLLKEDNPSRLEDAIRCGGLAKVKSERIYEMFRTIQEERGAPSLEYLRQLSDDQVKQDLGRFRGMGPKTISCVMLFAMGRPEFPVDTHVLRIAKQMGWVASSMGREDAYDYLNERIPAPLKLDLHCLLIAHGKQCHRCAARGKPQFPPKDGSKLKCPLVNVGRKAKKENGLAVVKEVAPTVLK